MVDGKSYFLVGVGGSGMMPLAMILAGRGAQVAGSDRSLDAGRVPAKFDALRALGVDLFPQDGSGIVSAEQILVASAAIEEDVADMVAARRIGATVLRRPELLAQLFNESALPIGVAGTSGKSTVTGMIGWILHATGRDPTVMNGAVMTNFARADAPFASALVGGGSQGGGAFVSEVDESDGSIAFYRPRIAVLTNVSLDHKSLDELRALFGAFAASAATTVVNVGDPEAALLLDALHASFVSSDVETPATPLEAGPSTSLGTNGALMSSRLVTVAVDARADLSAVDLKPEPFSIGFTLVTAGERYAISLSVPGRHNVANALAAIGAARAAGVPLADACRAIEGFSGLKRRFELIGEARGVAVIDDFGHNPDKIAATLDTLHAFPGRLLLLFQPHGYGPLKVMCRELMAMLAAKVGIADVLVLCDPVYQGGTVTREVTSADIVSGLAYAGVNALHIADRAAAAAHLVALAEPGDRIIVMGARDDTLGQLAREMVDSLARRD